MLRSAGFAFISLALFLSVAACGAAKPQAQASALPDAAAASAAPDRGSANPHGAAAESAAPPLMTSHGSQPAAAVVTERIPQPEGGIAIADVWTQRKSLSGKTVTVRGRVVKANNGILGTNWVHLQDGTGSAADRTNDLTITTAEFVKVGDTITITGVLATGKEIGEGYAYDVIVENATVAK